jgi:endonuclease YncB( thermonuclease family)
MRKKSMEFLLLLIIIAVLIAMNYTSLNTFVVKNISPESTIIVNRVIDGDTVVYKNGNISQSVRLLGINTPEKGEYLYNEAKKFNEKQALNKSLIVESKGKDLYGRELAYLYDGDRNLNLELVREGYAGTYFPEGKDIHYEQFSSAWEECLNKNVNLCEKSLNKCASCIQLKEWDFESQTVVLYSKCNLNCNLSKWTIKDEGRKKYTFGNISMKSNSYIYVIVGNKTDSGNKLYWKGQTYVWTRTGDSIFLRDSESKLVLWETNGY